MTLLPSTASVKDLCHTEYQMLSTNEKFDILSIPYFVIKDHIVVHDMVRLMTSVNTIRQRCPFGKRKATISSLFLDQVARDRSYTESERHRYENNWNLALNARGSVSPVIKREDYLDAVKTIKNLRQQDEQPSNPPILPSYKTRQTPLQERHQERQWKLAHGVPFILFFIGMDRTAILVDLFKG